jgi:Zn-dependent protease with chaperone function
VGRGGRAKGGSKAPPPPGVGDMNREKTAGLLFLALIFTIVFWNTFWFLSKFMLLFVIGYVVYLAVKSRS